jgi:hypothetical protein
MTFRDDEFDVYVTEGALAIVHRGEHVASAQMFGVDWDGPSHSVMRRHSTRRRLAHLSRRLPRLFADPLSGVF